MLLHLSCEKWSRSAAAAAKSLQSCPTLCDPMDGSPPAPPSLGFSRQEHWNGLPFPSPVHESEKWKWSTPWMIQQMLAIWSLLPLPFLNAAWTSGSSWFMYCWRLTWRILSITLLVCEMSAFVFKLSQNYKSKSHGKGNDRKTAISD